MPGAVVDGGNAHSAPRECLSLHRPELFRSFSNGLGLENLPVLFDPAGASLTSMTWPKRRRSRNPSPWSIPSTKSGTEGPHWCRSALRMSTEPCTVIRPSPPLFDTMASSTVRAREQAGRPDPIRCISLDSALLSRPGLPAYLLARHHVEDVRATMFSTASICHDFHMMKRKDPMLLHRNPGGQHPAGSVCPVSGARSRDRHLDGRTSFRPVPRTVQGPGATCRYQVCGRGRSGIGT